MKKIMSGLIGLFSGAIVSIPIGYHLGFAVLRYLNAPTSDGGGGIMVVLIVIMFTASVFAIPLCLLNVLLAKKSWPKIVIALETILSVITLGLIVKFLCRF